MEKLKVYYEWCLTHWRISGTILGTSLFVLILGIGKCNSIVDARKLERLRKQEVAIEERIKQEDSAGVEASIRAASSAEAGRIITESIRGQRRKTKNAERKYQELKAELEQKGDPLPARYFAPTDPGPSADDLLARAKRIGCECPKLKDR